MGQKYRPGGGRTLSVAQGNFTKAIDFRLLQPSQRRAGGGHFALARGGREPALLLELIGAPFDAINTSVRPAAVETALRPLLDVPRMSTMAIGALLNLAVATMPPDQAFVNVGTWHGYTLLAAMAGNPDVRCVGIDNFSELGGPRDEFGARFERARSPRHAFHDMDYREYLSQIHEGPIGFYLYDGEDSYDGQLEALRRAEPFFAPGCLVMADDTNRSHRRRAMLDFAEQSADDYSLVLDARTATNPHPTYWNGTLVLRRGRSGSAEAPHLVGHDGADTPAWMPDARPGSAVSVVLLAQAGGEARSRAIESIRSQTWSDVELIVAEPTPEAHDVTAALARALERCTGDYVSFVDTAAALRPDAVELSLAYPYAARFPRGTLETELLERLHTGLAAGADVDSVLPAGTPFVIASDHLALPDTVRAGPASRLVKPPRSLKRLSDEAVLEALRAAAAAGACHLVVMWMRFAWLDSRPGLTAHLSQHGSALVRNERVRVFALDGAA